MENDFDGSEVTSRSVMMAPDADQVNTSIWPGVSTMMYLSKVIAVMMHKNVVRKIFYL